MGRNKIKIKKIENERMRQVRHQIMQGDLLQKKKRVAQKIDGTVLAL